MKKFGTNQFPVGSKGYVHVEPGIHRPDGWDVSERPFAICVEERWLSLDDVKALHKALELAIAYHEVHVVMASPKQEPTP